MFYFLLSESYQPAKTPCPVLRSFPCSHTGPVNFIGTKGDTGFGKCFCVSDFRKGSSPKTPLTMFIYPWRCWKQPQAGWSWEVPCCWRYLWHSALQASLGLMSQYFPRLGPIICTVIWTRTPVLSTLAVQNLDLLKLLELRSVRTSWNNTAVSGADRRREHGWDGMDAFLLLIADCWWSSQCTEPTNEGALRNAMQKGLASNLGLSGLISLLPFPLRIWAVRHLLWLTLRQK